MLVAANSLSSVLDFATASSSPCFTAFRPEKMLSSSVSMASRIYSSLPSRRPMLLGVVTRSGLAGATFLSCKATGAVRAGR